MDESRVYVDFNEMPSSNEVLLSQLDSKPASDGNVVTFIEGQRVGVYSDDLDEHGHLCKLIADGVAIRNQYGGWTAAARWLLRIDDRGIRHEDR